MRARASIFGVKFIFRIGLGLRRLVMGEGSALCSLLRLSFEVRLDFELRLALTKSLQPGTFYLNLIYPSLTFQSKKARFGSNFAWCRIKLKFAKFRKCKKVCGDKKFMRPIQLTILQNSFSWMNFFIHSNLDYTVAGFGWWARCHSL